MSTGTVSVNSEQGMRAARRAFSTFLGKVRCLKAFIFSPDSQSLLFDWGRPFITVIRGRLIDTRLVTTVGMTLPPDQVNASFHLFSIGEAALAASGGRWSRG